MKVFVPAAGLGSRLDQDKFPKPLRSIGDLPLIVRVIRHYPKRTHFVFALGYESFYVRQVLDFFCPLLGMTYEVVVTDSWSAGGGLTKTLLDCKSLLQEPFIFHAVDSLLDGYNPQTLWEEEDDTAVFAKPPSKGTYRFIEADSWKKGERSGSSYVGVSKISDVDSFWQRMDSLSSGDDVYEDGETLGLNPKSLQILHFQGVWLDCGTEGGVLAAINHFPSGANILERSDEAIWQDTHNQIVVKFHKSSEFIVNRVRRSQVLQNFVPLSKLESPNMYSYPRAPGVVMSHAEPEVFQQLLSELHDFWFGDQMPAEMPRIDFWDFYKSKTIRRLLEFKNKYPMYAPSDINGSPVDSLDSLLERVPWDVLAVPRWSRCHGDLHTENIVFDERQGFMFLDWRQDFSGYTGQFGDIYYDLAKLQHGLRVDHGAVRNSRFEVMGSETESLRIQIDSYEKKSRWSAELRDFVTRHGLSWNRVLLLEALIFINIAPLHHRGYDLFLNALGHELLQSQLGASQ